MKKFLLSIMTLVYLASASGIAMQVHYCMGEQAGTSFFNKTKEKCSRCGMAEKSGCCSDEQQFYKLDNAHQHAKTDINFSYSSLLPLFSQTYFTEALPLSREKGFYSNSDPPPGSLSLHKFICVFRI